MSIENGWVKIHRSIQNQSWYKKPSICRLAEHLILSAEIKDKKFIYRKKEILIRRGQLKTSLREICRETGLTFQQARTALNVLSNTQFLTHKTTHHFTIITVCNYDRDQSKNFDSNTQNNTQVTHKQHRQHPNALTDKAFEPPKNIRNKEYIKEIKNKEKIFSDGNGNQKLIRWITEETRKGLITSTESKKALNEIQQGIFTEDNFFSLVSKHSARKAGEKNMYYH